MKKSLVGLFLALALMMFGPLATAGPPAFTSLSPDHSFVVGPTAPAYAFDHAFIGAGSGDVRTCSVAPSKTYILTARTSGALADAFTTYTVPWGWP